MYQDTANTSSRKLLVVAKGSENIQQGNTDIERKGVKWANMQIYCVWCLSTRVNVSRDIHSASTRMLNE
jgi:hypothetical protein